ncbi:MAG TPA: hypothetical protein VNK24_09870 [Elusimicrobiota bacterium]|nr:hypothetical protein [Elusimicrobiota bacterium]
MDAQEATENNSKETRGRPGKTIRLVIDLPAADAHAAHSMAGKRMRHLGEYVSLERIVSEAVEAYCKPQGAESAD